MRYALLLPWLLACRAPRPYVEIVEPADDTVVDPGSGVSVLAYAWDHRTLPEDLRLEAWYGTEAVAVTDAQPASTDDSGSAGDQGLRWVTLSLTVDHSDELRVYATDEHGLVDGATIRLCIDAGDCGQPSAEVAPAADSGT